jgi:hypothetical protein
VALTIHSPFKAEVKEKAELYLYSPSGPSRPVLNGTIPFIKYLKVSAVSLLPYTKFYNHRIVAKKNISHFQCQK